MPQNSIYDIDHREFSVIDTPIGFLRIIGNDEAIFEVGFLDRKIDTPKIIPKEVQKCAMQLKEYFEGERKIFNLNLKPSGTTFQQSVWNALLDVPFGTTSTYAKQATRLGDIKAIRAVGTANGKNPIPIVIPCHRIIGSDGSLTGYAGGLEKKEWLLKHEGVIRSTQIDMFS